jgi:hypothetical protein
MLSSEQTHTRDLFDTVSSKKLKCQHCGSKITGSRADPNRKGRKAKYCSVRCNEAVGKKRLNAKLKAATGVTKPGQWFRNNPEAMMVYAAKLRAKQKGLPFDLTTADITIPTHCPVLGIPLFRKVGKGHNANSPSLDRVDPAKGYVRGNVVVISMLANRIKSDATYEQILAVGRWLEQWHVNANVTLNMDGDGI